MKVYVYFPSAPFVGLEIVTSLKSVFSATVPSDFFDWLSLPVVVVVLNASYTDWSHSSVDFLPFSALHLASSVCTTK